MPSRACSAIEEDGGRASTHKHPWQLVAEFDGDDVAVSVECDEVEVEVSGNCGDGHDVLSIGVTNMASFYTREQPLKPRYLGFCTKKIFA